MKRTLCLALSVLGVVAAAASDPADGPAAFERLKTLEGAWEAAGKDGKKAVTVFELTANGSVLLERYANPELPGGGAMTTAYYLDGRDLVLTHYCIAKNQPTLRAERYDAAAGEVQFEFVRASNLPTPDAGHMRRAKYRFEGSNRFTTEWEFFAKGQKTMTEVETFTRVKPSASSSQPPAASSQLPAASFQLPAPSFQLPAPSFQLPASSFDVPFSRLATTND